MPPLVYSDLSWSGRFRRMVRTLEIIAIAGSIGATAGATVLLALMGVPGVSDPSPTPQVRAGAAAAAKVSASLAYRFVVDSDFASAAAPRPVSPMPAPQQPPATMAANAPPVAMPVPAPILAPSPNSPSLLAGAEAPASPAPDEPQTYHLYNRVNPSSVLHVAADPALRSGSPAAAQTKRTAAHVKKPAIVATLPAQPLDVLPNLGPFAGGERSASRGSYYDAWRGAPNGRGDWGGGGWNGDNWRD
jgi:hypothetical protein